VLYVFEADVSGDAFRAAMARLAAGVVLVTVHDPGDRSEGRRVGKEGR
jgi:flavin reductase (DIM6/NTAB) family NADH-FMN oxidoreductase RutF